MSDEDTNGIHPAQGETGDVPQGRIAVSSVPDPIPVPETSDLIDLVPGHGQCFLVPRQGQTIP